MLTFNAAYEEIPLAFRLTPTLRLIIPFDEYVKFISEVNCIDLLVSSQEIRDVGLQRFRVGDEVGYTTLLHCFGIDFCFALIKELFYAVTYGRDVTVIEPLVYRNGERVNYEIAYSNMHKSMLKFVLTIIKDTSVYRGYSLDIFTKAENYRSFWLALYIHWLSNFYRVWYFE